MAAATLTPRRLRAMRHDLEDFADGYAEYMNLTDTNGPIPPEAAQLRFDLLGNVARAERALARAGIQLLATPPPAVGGPVMRGLTNLVFAHETQRGRILGGTETSDLVADSLVIAEGKLALQEADARRRRRNPIYWADRLLTIGLGFPAYLLSRVLGVPVSRIEESRFAVAVRLIGLGVEVALLYFAITGIA